MFGASSAAPDESGAGAASDRAETTATGAESGGEG